MKIVILTGDANTLIYHRGDLIRDMAARGSEVITSAAGDYPHVHAFMDRISGRHCPIRMMRSRVNLRSDFETLLDMWRLFRVERPDALFAYTIKSVVYGCVMAAMAGVPKIYALLPGLGFTFVKPDTWKGKMVSLISRWLYRMALLRANAIFLQNEDDLHLLRELNILPRDVPTLVTAGSGVNLEEYPFVPLAAPLSGPLRFVLVSRLLVSKGVVVFAEAARRVKAKHPRAEFHLVGPFDPSPNRVTEDQVQGWKDEGLLTHHGMTQNVPAMLRDKHVFVLPTWYREGVPHATLEALSMGKPIITTDSVGARECVNLTAQGQAQRKAKAPLRAGRNGFLTPARDVDAVVQAMEFYLDHPEVIPLQGQASRDLAARVFNVRLVNELILAAMGLSVPHPFPQIVEAAETL